MKFNASLSNHKSVNFKNHISKISLYKKVEMFKHTVTFKYHPFIIASIFSAVIEMRRLRDWLTFEVFDGFKAAASYRKDVITDCL